MGQVRHRDVFFFPGYDIAGVKRYHRYLRRQCGWYQRRFEVEFEVGDLIPTTLEGWSVADIIAHWPEGETRTRFHFCDWRGDIAKDYAPNAAIRVWLMLKAVTHMAAKGHIRDVARKGPRFVAALGLPVYLTLLRAFCLIIAAIALTYGGAIAVGGCLAAAAGLFGLSRAGGAFYESFFNNFLAYLERVLYQPGHGLGGQLDAAIASLVAHGLQSDEARDELMIVGHSYGTAPAVIAADTLTKAGKDVSLLNVGSIAACVALKPGDTVQRPAMQALYQSKQICWREVFAPQDSLCFSHLNMARDYDLDVPRPPIADIKIRSARFGEFVARRKLHKFRHNLLRLHFQFLMAVDKQGGFDFHRYTLGPIRLKQASI